MSTADENAAQTASTRRWPRHQVKLPVRLAIGDNDSIIAGLATEISRSGMAVYGGVPLQPGDLMAVEFPTPRPVCIAGIVRNRTGFCFGLEFLSLVMGDPAGARDLAASLQAAPLNGVAEAELAAEAAHKGVVPAEEKLLAWFLQRHEAYLRHKEQELNRIRQNALRMRQLRQEVEALVRGLAAR